ncbi:hypothetical protein LCGC14_2740140 [marine sediment metagenome]|uniref:Uncharacterized protein n=1 Tax=marine sediment metagenome TaxID=412755 RepID=A0A0F8Z4P4_9ZZZZ
MPFITGPSLDELVKELSSWYIKTRGELIQALEEGYPYGSTPLTPRQQVDKFMSMTPEDWEGLVSKLVDRHRGKPDAEALARKDLEDYVAKMNRMGISRRAV